MQPGARLGPYEVVARIGAGGMGEVYRARDTRLGRDVALKVVDPGLASDPERLSRFEKEARAAAQLDHPNILVVHDVGTHEGSPFIVSELLQGESLREKLGAPLPPKKAVEYAIEIAHGLAAAHEKGIVHRDIKPENVFVAKNGHVKILDFGVAKLLPSFEASGVDTETPTASATQPGTAVGTVAYMSPEQIRGQPVDARSDLFSLGVVLYEMLSGKRPFQRDTPADTMSAILREEPPDLSETNRSVPAALESLVRHCLEKEPDGRFQAARDVVFALQALPEVLSTRPTAPMSPAGVWLHRHRKSVAGAMLLVAALVVAAAGIARLVLRERAGRTIPATKLLAVLPAADFTGRSDGRQLCDGFSVGLRSKLQRVSGVSIMLPAAARLETDAAKVASDTGANLILAPSARKSGDQVRLSYTLARASSAVQIDAGEVTGQEGDWFRLEDELLAKICASLEIGIAVPGGPPPREEIARGPSQSDYVVALGCLERTDDPVLLRKAAEILERIPVGNDSALVQAALGRAYLASFFVSKDVALAGRAKEAAERAVRLDPDLPEAQITVARVLRATGRPAEAVPTLRKVLETQPGNAEAVAVLGAALEGAGDFAGSEAAWRRVIELRSTSWAGHMAFGGFLFHRSRYEEAAGEYLRAIKLNPGVYGLYYSLGAVRIRQGLFNEAIGALKESIKIKPSSLAYSNLGTCQYLLGDFREASDSFERAITLTPADYQYRVYLGDALTWTPGQSEKGRQAYQDAIPLAEGVVRVNPHDTAAMGLLALCYARVGRGREADEVSERAVFLDPENGSVLHRAAVVALILGRRDESLRLLARAVERGYGTVELRADPEFSTLRNDSRFQQLLSGASGAAE